jgi:hypothetical protein
MQTLVDRFLVGYPYDGEWHTPNVQVVSLYVDHLERQADAAPSHYQLAMTGAKVAPASAARGLLFRLSPKKLNPIQNRPLPENTFRQQKKYPEGVPILVQTSRQADLGAIGRPTVQRPSVPKKRSVRIAKRSI